MVGEQRCRRGHPSGAVHVSSTWEADPSVKLDPLVQWSLLLSPWRHLLFPSTNARRKKNSSGGRITDTRAWSLHFESGGIESICIFDYDRIRSQLVGRVMSLRCYCVGEGLGGPCGLEDGDCLWDCCCFSALQIIDLGTPSQPCRTGSRPQFAKALLALAVSSKILQGPKGDPV